MSVNTHTYPEVFPASDLIVQSISGTGSAHHLSVPLQGEVGNQSPAINGAGCQLISHQPHGMLGGQAGHVVSDEGNAVAYGVVSEGVGSLPEPAAALVDVPVRAYDEALGAQSISDAVGWVQNFTHVLHISQEAQNLTALTCILCRPSLCPPGGSAAWSACLQSTAGRSGRAGSACECGG